MRTERGKKEYEGTGCSRRGNGSEGEQEKKYLDWGNQESVWEKHGTMEILRNLQR